MIHAVSFDPTNLRRVRRLFRLRSHLHKLFRCRRDVRIDKAFFASGNFSGVIRPLCTKTLICTSLFAFVNVNCCASSLLSSANCPTIRIIEREVVFREILRRLRASQARSK